MTQAQIENLMNKLNENSGAVGALTDFSKWKYSDLNLLLLHSLQCTGCNLYCKAMKIFWGNQGNCAVLHSLKDCIHCRTMFGLFRLHVKCCTKENCEIPRCSDVRR